MRSLPRYGIAGVLIMLVSEIGMLLQVEPFWSWHTPTAWTGYILFVDAWVWKRRGHSWVRDAPREFLFLAALSVPLWLVFEWYNKYFIHNWHYVNLPENLALRYFGYAWSFATIWPAIFETSELVASFRKSRDITFGIDAFGLRHPALGIAVGAVLLIWPIAWPSPYLAAPVWLGFIFLLDPANRGLGAEGLTWHRTVNLAVAGIICGIVWEFWNYWARTKWIYDVPILPELRIFEMPVLGYGGFPAFALECFTMYVFVRWAFWRGARRPISI
ncbi:MAG TPA: hypothetical protein VK886_20010 [Vicinamibacterales bacterium]|nr:hypothetical protein [Vicinamibacterales bacterium]